MHTVADEIGAVNGAQTSRRTCISNGDVLRPAWELEK